MSEAGSGTRPMLKSLYQTGLHPDCNWYSFSHAIALGQPLSGQERLLRRRDIELSLQGLDSSSNQGREQQDEGYDGKRCVWREPEGVLELKTLGH